MMSLVQFPMRSRCKTEQYGSSSANPTTTAISMDCDHVVFHGEFPPIPLATPVISYSQRFSGQQFVPTQVTHFFESRNALHKELTPFLLLYRPLVRHAFPFEASITRTTPSGDSPISYLSVYR